MFGFSRGAFTVRTLAGLIGTCGLINPAKAEAKTFKGLRRAVEEAYSAYRKCYRRRLWRRLFGEPDERCGNELPKARIVRRRRHDPVRRRLGYSRRGGPAV